MRRSSIYEIMNAAKALKQALKYAEQRLKHIPHNFSNTNFRKITAAQEQAKEAGI